MTPTPRLFKRTQASERDQLDWAAGLSSPGTESFPALAQIDSRPSALAKRPTVPSAIALYCGHTIADHWGEREAEAAGARFISSDVTLVAALRRRSRSCRKEFLPNAGDFWAVS